ncbi:sigma-70 family RNA polymerase sigma factor [Flavobacteriaceae bacterium R38]|nr:sigma-70 family RNA polymerase sigma factor [Flavobacteriaceae bacterium R38]
MPNSLKSICDQKVYNQVFDDHVEELRNFLYYRCGDMAQAEDITQDAFIKLWNHCKKVLFEKARGFLYKVAKNQFYNEVTHKKVVLDYEKIPHSTFNNETPQFKMEENEFMINLQESINRLPQGQREVFLLNRVDKKTYREIAELLGVSQKAIEKRMHKALVKLRKTIKNI